MKSRLSYFLISGIIILSIFTGTLIWRHKHLKNIPKFKEKSFTAPISSKYVPTNADLIFHWKINPNILPNKEIKLIRDSAFNLISVDFKKDISKWAGSYGTFAIFDTHEKLFNDWLMVLEVKKDISIEEELESILGQNLLDKNVSSSNKLEISKSKIISKKINSNQSIYFANDKNNILISSNPKTIKSSINNSIKNRFTKKEKYKNFKIKDNINDGILLLEISPKIIFNLIDQKKNLLEINQADKLISSI